MSLILSVSMCEWIRARVNCPRHLPLSVKDLDGDRVQCRFASADLGECVDCTGHSFLQLEKVSLDEAWQPRR